MMMAKVIEKIVSTRKHETMQGVKLLAVEGCMDKTVLVAGDLLGAGIGEYVLVTCGATAKLAASKEMPVDAMIVGIMDEPPEFLR